MALANFALKAKYVGKDANGSDPKVLTKQRSKLRMSSHLSDQSDTPFDCYVKDERKAGRSCGYYAFLLDVINDTLEFLTHHDGLMNVQAGEDILKGVDENLSLSTRFEMLTNALSVGISSNRKGFPRRRR